MNLLRKLTTRRAGPLLLLLGLLGGCSVFDFDIEQPVPEQLVRGNPLSGLLGTLVPTPFPLTINFAQETQARGTGPVRAAGLTSLVFQITPTAMPAGDSDDFNFVQSVDIFIESTSQGTALTRQKIADLPSVPQGQMQLSLRTYPDINLVPYINEGARVSSTATGSTPPDDVTFNGKLVVHVNTF